MAGQNFDSTGRQIVDGEFGSIQRFDLTVDPASDPIEVNQVLAVQIENQVPTPSKFSAVQTSDVGPESLFSYPSNANCPDFAWAVTGTNLDVFTKKTVFTNVALTNLLFWYFRDALNVAVPATDKVDVPEEARHLWQLLVLQYSYLLSQKNPRFDIDNAINAERQLLGV